MIMKKKIPAKAYYSETCIMQTPLVHSQVSAALSKLEK